MPSPASPGTNQYRCNACGRHFNTAEALRGHSLECRTAKEATSEGRAELEREDATPHKPNDQKRNSRGQESTSHDSGAPQVQRR